uniref:Uncharacterized protein n=1 Tax=Arundo donax TaxID=35708 RepID=A0A0A8ZXN8_ARUDO
MCSFINGICLATTFLRSFKGIFCM